MCPFRVGEYSSERSEAPSDPLSGRNLTIFDYRPKLPVKNVSPAGIEQNSEQNPDFPYTREYAHFVCVFIEKIAFWSYIEIH